jgi:hypothetical protein
MLRRQLACAAIVACSSMAGLSVVQAQTRAVIELFTSQGCSSCPAADKLLGELATDPTLITISLPIDYWDYLGWKDTLAKPRHSARQRGYSKVRGDREVYTPQVVVNGSYHAQGSDRAAIERMIVKSHQNPATLSVPVTLSIANGRLTLTMPERPAGRTSSSEIWVLGITKAVTVTIKRGENKGKTITYHNVARRWLRLDWASGKPNWSVPVRDFEDEGVDSAAVFVQAGTVDKPSAMLGAAMASIR